MITITILKICNVSRYPRLLFFSIPLTSPIRAQSRRIKRDFIRARDIPFEMEIAG